MHMFKLLLGISLTTSSFKELFTDTPLCDGLNSLIPDTSIWQPCKDLNPSEDSNTKSNDNKDDASDAIVSVETEGDRLNNATIHNKSNEPDANSGDKAVWCNATSCDGTNTYTCGREDIRNHIKRMDAEIDNEGCIE
jgi:hypothetical protein